MFAPTLADQRLLAVLGEARDRGFLGPGPVDAHIQQAQAYLPALPGAPAVVVDLGTGGGVPGLALALWRPDLTFCLVDAMARRTAFVSWAAEQLALQVRVVTARAEELGRSPEWRGTVDTVVARSLATPAATAEYAAPLLRVGGTLLVAEPPDHKPERWPPQPLGELGLSVEDRLVTPDATIQRLRQAAICPERFPRRIGMPAKRPLFGRDVSR